MCRRGHNNTRGANPPKTREPLDTPRSYLCVQVAGKWKTGGQRWSCPLFEPQRQRGKSGESPTHLAPRPARPSLRSATSARNFFDNRAKCCVKSRHSHSPLPFRSFKIMSRRTPGFNFRFSHHTFAKLTNSTKHGAQPLKAAVVAFKPQHTKTWFVCCASWLTWTSSPRSYSEGSIWTLPVPSYRLSLPWRH